MILWGNLPSCAQSGIMTVLFLVEALSFCALPVVWSHKGNRAERILLLLSALVSFALLSLLAVCMELLIVDKPITPLGHWMMELPAAAVAAVLAACVVSLVWALRDEQAYRKNTVTRASIKESMDNLPTGLCFAAPSGIVLLSNRRMNGLCLAITGEKLQNAEHFWQALCRKGSDEGGHPVLHLPDGIVWTFSRQTLGQREDTVVQFTAADTTQLHGLTDQLREQNQELAAMNARLRKYGASVDELTRSRERLETKARIHDQLGQALLATRHFLCQEEGDPAPVFDQWRRNISVLRLEAELPAEPPPLKRFLDAAQSAGICVDLEGALPARDPARQVILSAAAEALTNGVRHAAATRLRIQISRRPEVYVARFTNNGHPPQGEIAEGGGLGSLRRRVEQMGGTMTVASSPAFVLTISLPQERCDVL